MFDRPAEGRQKKVFFYRPHVYDIAGVPRRNVFVERCVSPFVAKKQLRHVRDQLGVPRGCPWSRFGLRSVVPETPSVSSDASLTKPIQSWIHCFNSSFDCGVGTTVYLVVIVIPQDRSEEFKGVLVVS